MHKSGGRNGGTYSIYDIIRTIGMRNGKNRILDFSLLISLFFIARHLKEMNLLPVSLL